MKNSMKIAAVSCAILSLGGCGSGEERRVPTEEENRRLNEISATLDNGQTIDTSPDSLTAGEPLEGNQAAPAAAGDNEAGNAMLNGQ